MTPEEFIVYVNNLPDNCIDERTEEHIIFHLPKKKYACPACGSMHTLVDKYRKQVLKGIPGTTLRYIYRVRRYRCNSCGKTFPEENPFLGRNQQLFGNTLKRLRGNKKISIAEMIRLLGVPQYIYQQAQIYYAKQDYQKACDLFMQLTHTPLRSGELFYEASQCKRMLRAPITEALALLDSAVAVCPRPLNSIASTYLLARGATYQEMGQYRLAVKDYNTYDSIAQGPSRYRDFYYQRYQCELKIKQFQQALNDLARTILLNPEEPVYYAEMASLCLRVKRNEDAEQAALRCTEIATDYADGFLLLGIARQELGKPEEARKALLRAKELGDKRADEYLKRK